MKYCVIGDFHLTNHTPVCRTDDYPETQKNKLKWIFDYCVDNHVNKIVTVGDFFDKAQYPLHFISSCFSLFKPLNTYMVNIPFHSVAGNHDLTFKSLLSNNSAFGVLSESGIIKKEPPEDDKECVFHFCHYGEDIPEPEKDKFNVLIIHIGISEEELNFEIKEPWYTAKDFLKEHKFDLVFSGHNHTRFKYSARAGKRRLYNCGSICRSSVKQKDHEPYIYIFDSVTKEVEEIPIPIPDSRIVIDAERHENRKEIDMKISSFVNGFEDSEKISLDFFSNLWNSKNVNEAEERVKKIITECVNGE
jgi:DNA repair exonuclease SbcCD nuclease subunit